MKNVGEEKSGRTPRKTEFSPIKNALPRYELEIEFMVVHTSAKWALRTTSQYISEHTIVIQFTAILFSQEPKWHIQLEFEAFNLIKIIKQ